MFANHARIYALITFVVVLCINLILRGGAISNEVLISDDLIYLPLALIDQCILPTRHPIEYNFICHVVGGYNLLVGRILFTLYMSAIAALLCATLIRFGINRWIATIASATAFSSVAVVSQVTFITGSYPLHGLLFSIAALFLVALNLSATEFSKPSIPTLVCIALLLVLAGVGSSATILMSLALVPLALYSWCSNHGWNSTLGWLTVALLPASIFVVLQFSGIFSNHYGGIVGWVSTEPARMFSQLNSHQIYLETALGSFNYYFLIATLGLSIAYYCYTHYRQLATDSATTNIKKHRHSLLIGIALAAIIATITPTLVIVGSQPRYLAIPLVFLIIQSFVILDLVLVRYSAKPMAMAVLGLALISGFFHVHALWQQHQKKYEKLIADQNKIKTTLADIKDQVQDNSQIVLLIEENTINSTSGFNHWSTHLARHAMQMNNITALIGKPSQLADDPFTKTYWAEKNGRSYRKRMIGLVKDRPTLIAVQSKGSHRILNCITLTKEDVALAMRADSTGIHPWNIASHGPTPKRQDCANYVIPTAIKGIKAPTGKLHQFSGAEQNLLTTQHKSDQPTIAYSMELTFRAQTKANQNFSYTKTSPPMPLLAHPLVIYQTKISEYKVSLSCEVDTIYNFNPISDWSNIRLEVDSNGVGTLKLNGSSVAVVGGCSNPTTISMGKGFLDRYWHGQIADFNYSSAIETLP